MASVRCRCGKVVEPPVPVPPGGWKCPHCGAPMARAHRVPVAAWCAAALGLALLAAGLGIRAKRARPETAPAPGGEAPGPAAAAEDRTAEVSSLQLRARIEELERKRCDLETFISCAGPTRSLLLDLPGVDAAMSDPADWQTRLFWHRLQPSMASVAISPDGTFVAYVVPALVVGRDGLLIAPLGSPGEGSRLTATFSEKGPSGLKERKDVPATRIASAWWGADLLQVKPEGEVIPVEIAQQAPAAGALVPVWGVRRPGGPVAHPHRFGVATVQMQEGCVLSQAAFERWLKSLACAPQTCNFVFSPSGALAGLSRFNRSGGRGSDALDPGERCWWQIEDPSQLRDLLARRGDGYPLPSSTATKVETPPYDVSAAIPVGEGVVAVDTFADGTLIVVRGGDRFSHGETDISIYPPGRMKPSVQTPRGVMRVLGLEVDRTRDEAYVLLAPEEAALAATLVRVDRQGALQDIPLQRPSIAFALCPELGRAIVIERAARAPSLLSLTLATGEMTPLWLPPAVVQSLMEDVSRVESLGIVCYPDGGVGISTCQVEGATWRFDLLEQQPGGGSEMSSRVAVLIHSQVKSTVCRPILDRTSGDLILGGAVVQRRSIYLSQPRPLSPPRWDASKLGRLSNWFGEYPQPDLPIDDAPLAVSRDGSRILSRFAIHDRASLSCTQVTDVWGPCGAFSPDGKKAYVYDRRGGVLVPFDVSP